MSYVFKTMDSPVGRLTLVGGDAGLAALLFGNDRASRRPFGEMTEEVRYPVLVKAQRELEEYFTGRRRTFTVKLDATGTDFQQLVWDALRTIPYGQTRSYGQIAEQIGRRTAVRAVGAANHANPIAIIVPCHRVIGSNGKLTGYAGGLHIKARLLALET
ncbi:MAG TPA: methylated-DNA--[protein]-cysteine S-methyltransferase [Steroidobacteraceae bacterium]|nr:methylated-DNA--[protein]-cysteine S-methyltransferase [Steroidobacteraceae bacterium]